MSAPYLGSNVVEEVQHDGYTLQPPPSRFEPGSPATEAVIGWGAAVDYLSDLGMDKVEKYCRELGSYARDRVASVEGVKVLGSDRPELRSSIVSFYIQGLESHAAARMLNHRANVCVRSGFHCAQPVHELLKSPPSIRVSVHVYNTREDIDILVEHLALIASLANT